MPPTKPHRYNSGHDSQAKSCHKPSHQELRHAERASLDYSSDQHDQGASQVAWLSSKSVAKREREQRTESRADFIGRDEETEQGCVRVAELVQEGGRCCWETESAVQCWLLENDTY